MFPSQPVSSLRHRQPSACNGSSDSSQRVSHAATYTKGSQATLVFTETLRPDVPRDDASMLDRKIYLDQQLDSLRETPVLGGLTFLPGLQNRLHGGVPLTI